MNGLESVNSNQHHRPPDPQKPETSCNPRSQVESVLSAISQPANEPGTRFEKPVVVEAAAFLAANSKAVDELCAQVFLEGIPTNGSFYDRLYRISDSIGFRDGASEVMGYIWAGALRKIGETEREALLRLLLECGHPFFILLDAIPVVLTGCRLQPQFCVEFFFALRTRIGNDLAGGGLWRGIEKWVAAFPEDAFNGLCGVLERQLDDDSISIGAAILGNLRVSWERTSPGSPNRETAEELKGNPDVAKRLIHHRSWINTGWLRGISHDEFTAGLSRMANGTAEERTEAFNFLRCLVADGRTQYESVEYGIEWLRIHSHTSLPDTSKHCVARIVVTVGGQSVSDDARLDTLRTVLTAAMPIPMANKGTWMEVEHFLVELLQRNRGQFLSWMLALVDADPNGIINQFSEHGRFEYLCSELLVHNAANVVASEFFSPIRHRRQLAFTLFDEIPFDTFLSQSLSVLSDDEVALCLFESRLHNLKPENTFRFLAALRDRAEVGAPQLVNLFRDELLYQAKNFPGAVLDGLKTIQMPSALVQQAIADADQYFAKLRPAHRSAINSMEIPGWRRALSIRGRRQSKDVEAHTDEFSVFKQFCSTSYLIYGNEGFRLCQDGEIGPLSKMQEMSVSMEMPRLTMIDPEGAVMRRHEAIRFTTRLAKVVCQKKGVTCDS